MAISTWIVKTGNERPASIAENLRAARSLRSVIHTRRDHAQRPRKQPGRVRPFRTVPSHIIHLTVETALEPCGEAGLRGREIGICYSDRLESQFASPRLDGRSEHREIDTAHAPRVTSYFRVIHFSNDSQPSAGAHWSADLADEAATLQLGAKLASSLKPGMRVYLRGELGSGKTTLIRGLLRSLGIRGGVKSPSYSLVELYVTSRLNLYHFDFYRFVDPNEFADAGFADYFRSDGICLVEWPERAGAALPPADLEIQFAYKGAARAVSVRALSERGARCLEILRGA